MQAKASGWWVDKTLVLKLIAELTATPASLRLIEGGGTNREKDRCFQSETCAADLSELFNQTPAPSLDHNALPLVQIFAERPVPVHVAEFPFLVLRLRLHICMIQLAAAQCDLWNSSAIGRLDANAQVQAWICHLLLLLSGWLGFQTYSPDFDVWPCKTQGKKTLKDVLKNKNCTDKFVFRLQTASLGRKTSDAKNSESWWVLSLDPLIIWLYKSHEKAHLLVLASPNTLQRPYNFLTNNTIQTHSSCWIAAHHKSWELRAGILRDFRITANS